jgi:two-component system sensor histidine kinase UhpB
MVGSALDLALADVPADDEQLAPWLARELHDGVVQRLTTSLVSLELLRREGTPVSGPDRLAAAESDVRAGLHEMRELLRRLRGAAVVEPDLVEAIRGLLEDVARRSSIDVELVVSPTWPTIVPAETAHQLRRIVQECLTNVRLHAGAERVRVTLEMVAGAARVSVADDGRGHTSGAAAGGLGLLGMSERAAILGATLEIVSRAGRGTEVSVTLAPGALELVGEAR